MGLISNIASRLFSVAPDAGRTEPVSNWPIYQVGTTVVVPHVLKVEGSYSADAKPFQVFDAADPDLASKLESLFSGENMKVVRHPVPPDPASDKEFLALLGVRSWKGLYQKCRHWSILRRDERFRVNRLKIASVGRGMELDEEATARIEKDMSLDGVVAFFMRELRAT